MSFEYTVVLNDPANVGGASDSVLVYDLEQALGIYSQYITGAGDLVVQLNIVDTAVGRADGTSTATFQIGKNGSLNLLEPSSQYELTTGQHVKGTTSDIIINVDPTYIQGLDLAPDLTLESQVPSNKLNPEVVFLHELTHGFGMNGFLNQSGTLSGSYESNFDALIQITPSGAAYFMGANADAAYGGPVPLTSDSTTENYYHFGNNQSDLHATSATVGDPLTLDLMNGIVFFDSYPYTVSPLDLAVLKDLGYNINTNFQLSKYETVVAGGENISFTGDDYHDIAIFHGASAQYSLGITSVGPAETAHTTDSVGGRDFSDSFTNVEFLQFADKTIFVENPDNANIARLYSATFDRAPDINGLTFWEDTYAKSISASVKSDGYYVSLAETNDGSGTSIAGGFMQSSEFLNRYGTLTDSSFVTQLYENVLGRAPDQAGLNFWTSQLEGGGQTREVVLVGFAESPENVAKTGSWLIAA